MVMVALGTTAPEGSATVPLISAFSCAHADATHENVTNATPSAHLTTFICPPKNGPAFDGIHFSFLEAESNGSRRHTLSARANRRSHVPLCRRWTATQSRAGCLTLDP